MEQLPRLQARIASLQELRDLFGALRALAASRVREAHTALTGIRRYVAVVEDAISEGLALLPAAGELTAFSVPSEAAAMVIVCTEHGFAGAFNERLLDRAAELRKPGQKLLIIGWRGAMLAAERGLAVDRRFHMATHAGGVLGVTRRVADYLAAVSAADVVFGSYQRGTEFETESKTILPMDPALLNPSRQPAPPLHHLAPDTLLQRLLSEYLFAEITRAVMESLASENAARLRVMEAADHSIDDKLQVLRRRENVLRQEAITSELLDVVTGSEAILTAPGG